MTLELTDEQIAAMNEGGCPMSRRGFLGAVGAGAGAIAGAGALLVPASSAIAKDGGGSGGGGGGGGAGGGSNRFGQMFPQLKFFAKDQDDTALQAALMDLGRPGGILDNKDNLVGGPAALCAPDASRDNPKADAWAGMTFLGQFLDHDITADSSILAQKTSFSLRNGRTASFDLDSVYGGGPVGSPQLYEAGPGAVRGRLAIGTARTPFEDVPRDASNVAIIPDGRNDENAGIDGLQAAFLKFHNAVLDSLPAGDPDVRFAKAKQTVTWHYQWMILNQFLPSICGANRVGPGGRKFYVKNVGDMPVEFQTAAYRYGHATVRAAYRLNMKQSPVGGPRHSFIFDASQRGGAAPDPSGPINNDPDDMSGGFPGSTRAVGWESFFPVIRGGTPDSSKTLKCKLINAKLSSPLFDLPLGVIRAGGGPVSLAQRNLLRHITWQLPSGQDVARTMGMPPLTTGDLKDLAPYSSVKLDTSTPLWYYVLKEAEVQTGGQCLGQIGGRIVSEVFIGLLENDPASVLNAGKGWTPSLGRGNVFEMADLLHVAGVDGSR